MLCSCGQQTSIYQGGDIFFHINKVLVAFYAASTVYENHVLGHAPQRKGLSATPAAAAAALLSRRRVLFLGQCISLLLHFTFPPLRHQTQNTLSNERLVHLVKIHRI